MVDGVQVSFENSTVCRALFFWFDGLCQIYEATAPRVVVSFVLPGFVGEFDPGSGRTLAACLTHASRAVRPFGVHERRTGE